MAKNKVPYNYKNWSGKWTNPKKRSKAYFNDLKAKKWTYGPYKDKELTPIEKGVRLGYLQRGRDEKGLKEYINYHKDKGHIDQTKSQKIIITKVIII